ncbi:DUF4124 domain-containing protein [Sansalvadorimonas verongulae]|uniref:DUF4124 domain-containing protein n=1 Tax=Sansalvadorimonas verongulae TaxID=2172824 RepID=UPI0018AD2333|nr:DUF4124 domain-containing protein [Sansalvadorimonas verongulae]
MTASYQLLLSGLLAALITVPAVQAQVYRTVDANGNVIYTDKKPKDSKPSEKVEIGPILTLPATPVRPRPPRTSAKEQRAAAYKSVVITAPEDQKSFPNPASISVAAKVTPALQSGHRFRLLVNGEVEQDSKSPRFQIKRPNRGAHSLQVQVIDGRGKALISSKTSTIYVHRHRAHINREGATQFGKKKEVSMLAFF